MPDSLFYYPAHELPRRLAQDFQGLRARSGEALDQIERTFGSVQYLVPWYVQPDAQNVNPADTEEDDSGLVARTSAFEILAKFLAKTSRFSHGLILSDAGMGKTSLLVELKLFHLARYMPAVDQLILLKLGPDTLQTIDAIDRPSSTILLLDALDEDEEAWESLYTRLQLLLRRTDCFRKVIITCRTQFFPQQYEEDGHSPGVIRLSGFQCSKLFLSPFTDRQVQEFLDLRFSDDSERDRALSIVKHMNSLKFRPMLLSYIDLLLDDERRTSFANAYRVYHEMVEAWLDRELKKGNISDKAAVREACTLIALEMYRNRTRDYHSSHLPLIYKKITNPQKLEYMSVEGRSLLQRTSEDTYKFAHYSILEYFVATQLATAPEQCRNTDQVKAFLGDLLAENRLETCRGLDLSSVRLSNLLHPHLNFAGADLTDVHLSKSDLSKAEFAKANLTGARFEDVKLVKAGFFGTTLSKVQFARAEMDRLKAQGQTFTECKWTDCTINAAELEGVRFQNCKAERLHMDNLAASELDLSGLEAMELYLCGCKLERLQLSRSTVRGLDIRDSAIEDAEFQNSLVSGFAGARATLKGCNFDSAVLQGATLESSQITNCNARQINLDGADLRESLITNCRFDAGSLANAVLKNAQILEKCSLAGCRISGADFTGAVIRDATLDGVFGENACLARTQLTSVSFKDARLPGCDLQHTSLQDVSLEGTSLNKSKFDGCRVLNVRAPRAQLIEASFKSAQIVGTDLCEALLDKVALHGASLVKCAVRDASMKGAEIENTEISGSDFQHTDLQGSRFVHSKVKGTDFSRADLRGAVLTGATFEGCQWDAAFYDSLTKWPTGFDVRTSRAIGPNADLRRRNFGGQAMSGQDLRGASIDGANLANVDLKGANLANCSLVGSDLTRASLENANLCGANLEGAVIDHARFTGAEYDNHTVMPRGLPPGKFGMKKRA